MCIWRGYTAAQVNHSVFNISNSFLHFLNCKTLLSLSGQIAVNRHSASHPPHSVWMVYVFDFPHPPPARRPPIDSIRDITGDCKIKAYLKNQHCITVSTFQFRMDGQV